MPSVVAAYVTRPEVGGGNLTLTDPGTYKIRAEGLDIGVVDWRRQLAVSPFVRGAIEVAAIEDQVGASMVVDVTATAQSTLQTRVTTLLAAFKQSTYELHISMDGTDWAWKCMRASYSVAFSQHLPYNKFAAVTLQFPRSPVPVAGPF